MCDSFTSIAFVANHRVVKHFTSIQRSVVFRKCVSIELGTGARTETTGFVKLTRSVKPSKWFRDITFDDPTLETPVRLRGPILEAVSKFRRLTHRP